MGHMYKSVEAMEASGKECQSLKEVHNWTRRIIFGVSVESQKESLLSKRK